MNVVETRFFLDGSGGELAKDKRLRRCGWGWTQSQGEDEDGLIDYIGQSGGLQAMYHTVPRAAATNPLQCLPGACFVGELEHRVSQSD